MMWFLLFALTALALLLPMWPAIQEWRRPSDVVPLHIDTEDALDPPFLARSFAARLAEAVAAGQTQLGQTEIATAPAFGDWPLTGGEQRDQSSARVWRSESDTVLPDGISFLAEVAAPGNLCTAPGGVYRALWAGRRLLLAPHSAVLRWAHGRQVDVAAGCRLAGRVSADQGITFGGLASFTLLHAPMVRFEPVGMLPFSPRAAAVRPGTQQGSWPSSVQWDPVAGRATSDEPLDMGDHRTWTGDLVARDELVLGTGCLADGSLKSRADIVTGSACTVAGSVVAEGRIALGARSTVWGSVVSETAIVLGAGCVVGAPGRPATVAAPHIDVGPGVVVHGTLWAAVAGRRVSETLAQGLPDGEPEAPLAFEGRLA